MGLRELFSFEPLFYTTDNTTEDPGCQGVYWDKFSIFSPGEQRNMCGRGWYPMGRLWYSTVSAIGAE